MTKLKPPPANRLRQYGITPEQWQEMYDAQDGRCGICKRTFTLRRLPCVDHAHRSGLVRGLLCHYCNQTIGYLHEDADWLWHAYKYLVTGGIARKLRIVAKHVRAPGSSSEHARVNDARLLPGRHMAGNNVDGKNTILGEEVGEVANAILEGDDDNLAVELVQVAAVCMAWLESRMEYGR